MWDIRRSRRRFGIRRLDGAATYPQALAELLALLGRHSLPAFGDSPPKIGAMKATTTNPSEQKPAQSQQSDSLPEGNLPPYEQHREQPVPQMHHQFAANCDEDRHPYDRQWCYPNQFLSHVVCSSFFLNSSPLPKLVVNALQPFAQMQHRVALARE